MILVLIMYNVLTLSSVFFFCHFEQNQSQCILIYTQMGQRNFKRSKQEKHKYRMPTFTIIPSNITGIFFIQSFVFL